MAEIFVHRDNWNLPTGVDSDGSALSNYLDSDAQFTFYDNNNGTIFYNYTYPFELSMEAY